MEVQDAVRQSIVAFEKVFPAEVQKDLRLEEVVLSPDEEVWSTTLSFLNPQVQSAGSPVTPTISDLAALFETKQSSRRTYKTIRMRATDGRLLGIVNAA